MRIAGGQDRESSRKQSRKKTTIMKRENGQHRLAGVEGIVGGCKTPRMHSRVTLKKGDQVEGILYNFVGKRKKRGTGDPNRSRSWGKR